MPRVLQTRCCGILKKNGDLCNSRAHRDHYGRCGTHKIDEERHNISRVVRDELLNVSGKFRREFGGGGDLLFWDSWHHVLDEMLRHFANHVQARDGPVDISLYVADMRVIYIEYRDRLLAEDDARRNRFNQANQLLGLVPLRARPGGPNPLLERVDPEEVPAPVERRELEVFAQDRQNVHTQVMVQRTIEMIKRVLTIKVDDGYKWSRNEMSKTPGEIIVSCKLAPQAASQMILYYASDVTIYEMDAGIYGKVLDSVWQYIKNSPNRSDLCKILGQELYDNIGMCAQGNLTRLCNVLAGYVDGIGETQETPNSILQRKFPALMDIEDEEERIEAATELLSDVGLPRNEWGAWLEPLYV